MIDTTHRFQGYGSLRFVYQKGQTIRGPFCSLKFIANRRRGTYRAAVVVSRKVHKSAIVRNRIRRRIYEIIRTHEDYINEPFDLVFIVYNEQLATMPSAELQATILEKLAKAGVFSNDPTPMEHQRAIVERKEN